MKSGIARSAETITGFLSFSRESLKYPWLKTVLTDRNRRKDENPAIDTHVAEVGPNTNKFYE